MLVSHDRHDYCVLVPHLQSMRERPWKVDRSGRPNAIRLAVSYRENRMHISRIGRRVSIVLGIAGLVSLVAIGTVAARSAPPDMGRGVDFSEEHCFSLFFSHVRNDCPEPHNYEMPLTVDNAGGKTVTVNVFSPTGIANEVCCEAVATDEAVQFQSRSNRVCTNALGTQTLTLTGSQVPGRGRMFASCTLLPGGVINTLNWNQ
jgi:hypothetical protein